MTYYGFWTAVLYVAATALTVSLVALAGMLLLSILDRVC